MRAASKDRLTRREKTILAKFRTGGHTPELGWYKHFITRGKEKILPAECERCGENETMEHYLLSCPFLAQTRHEIFGAENPIDLLFTDNTTVAKYLRNVSFSCDELIKSIHFIVNYSFITFNSLVYRQVICIHLWEQIVLHF